MSALADALGHRAVRKLSELAGGRSLRIPEWSDDRNSVAARGRLVALVGVELATDLITAFAGARVFVPSGGRKLVNQRVVQISRAEVMRLTRRGWSAARIAERLGCSERWIYTIRSKAKRVRVRGGA